MAHPFLKMFLKALKDSDEMNNLVTKEAVKLIKKGYSRQEVGAVLVSLQRSLIEPTDSEIVAETIDELDLLDQ